ncbi:MAG: type II toxin-antitoxin system RelE/ParE family toxin [bacterium]|jgi:putative addiction module killer protein|nr:type II toxin-antitoxin system RelE/ParE family toxin [Betaproteobacteria bacterium]
MFELQHHVTLDGRDPFGEWIERLDLATRARIEVRLGRLERGLFGDCKSLRAGVWELRIDHGPGWRVYFGREGAAIVVLLAGGRKRTQAKDIERAIGYWQDHQGQRRGR